MNCVHDEDTPTEVWVFDHLVGLDLRTEWAEPISGPRLTKTIIQWNL